ncbi:hypothetical protein GGTG_05144 [Gaeumannomyces tritici R3-111a-1]|uniref:Myb/SANT-like domain-containing protein n=1 Tax=Gaeumannomyces tritici (strain R3-111a-1) TaxID=644352 RepID=J3NV32_GAET3|nr:hypothetical protein GGTG_05144 [Gaeumannomyces tritici R3-111a-1]EJT75207.1 hypothetical protein GGTG_05144 [Gaeumannomyces tritici R3-111a-1]
MPSYRSLRLQRRHRGSQNRAQSEPPSDPPAFNPEETFDPAEALPATQATATLERTSQASQEAGKRNDWSVDQLLTFLESLAESGRQGMMNPAITSWLSKCLKIAAMTPSTRWPFIRWFNRVKNKYNSLKSQYRDWVDFGKRSGVSVDPVTGLYLASDYAWEAFFAVRPNARWMRRRPLFRPDLHEAAFAGRWATGQQIATAAQRLAEEDSDEGPAR